MQIIDMEKKGNLVRFYLGENGKQWGDDWNDYPYEYNSGRVYDEYIKGIKDVAFSFDDVVLEPCDGANNSRISKQDMIKRKVPCLIVVPKSLNEGDFWTYENFNHWIGVKGVKKYYFGDEMGD